MQPKPINTASTDCDYNSTPASFHDSDVFDIAMDDTISGAHLHDVSNLCHGTHEFLADPGQHFSQQTVRQPLRIFEDLLLADENINPSNSFENDPSPVTETQNPPQRRIQRVLLTLRDSLQTAFNEIGLC
jgi:hypothetical protein